MDHCSFILNGFRTIFAVMLTAANAMHMTRSATEDIPQDVRSILTMLDIKPTAKSYCCCPKCFCLYDLDDFPDHCTQSEAPGAPPCGRSLRRHVIRAGKTRNYAARRYLYHDLKAWMGELLSRPGMEEHLDRDVFQTGAAPGEKRDMWDGDILRNFKGDDGLLFVGPKKGKEGRYVFGLNMDGFNPFMNKQAGKKKSCGAIYMVCMNLPPHLRHRVENMFLVSIIPGPHHPSLIQINDLLRPLVDELLRFWHHGVYYSRTFRYPKGRLVRLAIVPVICDLPAARQMMAFASHSSSHFCCYCGLLAADMDNLNIASWPKGVSTREEYVAFAEEWKAASVKCRKKLFDEHGIRWSELLRLPYWDPTRFVVIDSMHALFLTALKHHCRDYWGMDANIEDGSGKPRPKQKKRKQSTKPNMIQMGDAWEVVRRGGDSAIARLGLQAMRDILFECDKPTGGHRNKLVKQIQELVRLEEQFVLHVTQYLSQRRDQGWVDENGRPKNPLPPKPKRTDPPTEAELQRATLIISSARTPQYVERNMRRPVMDALAAQMSTTLDPSSVFYPSKHLEEKMTKIQLAERLISIVCLRPPPFVFAPCI